MLRFQNHRILYEKKISFFRYDIKFQFEVPEMKKPQVQDLRFHVS